MKKPSQSLVKLLGSEKFKSGKGSATDLVNLLQEQDGILAEMQKEAEDIVTKDLKWREVIKEHWFNLARWRVDFLGCVDGVHCIWSDGLEWHYPVDSKGAN